MEDNQQAKRAQKWLNIPEIPDKMAIWLYEHYSNLQINVCNTDVECGYGIRRSGNVKIALPYERCNRCGYHSLWNPDDSEEGCRARGGRHTLQRGWDDVFSWNIEGGWSLEDAFDSFIKENNNTDRKGWIAWKN